MTYKADSETGSRSGHCCHAARRSVNCIIVYRPENIESDHRVLFQFGKKTIHTHSLPNTDRQTDRQTDRHTDRHTYRHTDRHTDRHTHHGYNIRLNTYD